MELEFILSLLSIYIVLLFWVYWGISKSRRTRATCTFVCTACLDDNPGKPVLTIHENDYCKECFESGLKPQFEQYLKDETKPVSIGGKPVEIDDVKRHFSKNFISAYKIKMLEYAVLPADRLYCVGPSQVGCGKYLGRRNDHSSSRPCAACAQRTCGTCNARVDQSITAHVCKKSEEADPLEGLERGRDYQRCPKCQTPGTLIVGCNHITCRICKPLPTEYCFICGEEVLKNDRHWSPGKPCPRYNQPDADNAIYDHEYLETRDGQRLWLPQGVSRHMLAHLTAAIDEHLGPEMSPERTLRNQDQLVLSNIIREANRMSATFANRGKEVPGWLRAVRGMAGALQDALDVYIHHQVTNPALLRAIAFQHERRNPVILRLHPDVGEGWQHREFVMLRPILNAYRMALQGRVEKLRELADLWAT